MKVWIDGTIVDGADAKLSVQDHGLLYGDGVFEGIRVYGGTVFRLHDHMRRLSFSAAYIGLELPFDIDRIAQIVLETVTAHGESEAYVRLVVTRGIGELGVDPTLCSDPQVICMASTISLYSAATMEHGVNMVTVSTRKPPPDVLNPEVKSLNYLNSVMAKREARMRGADEALVLNLQGTVAEASVANVFALSCGVLVTPPTVDGALPGITRATVLEIARDLGVTHEVRSIGHAELMRADEVFLSGTGARLVPVGQLDGVVIGNGERPLTRRITDTFISLASSNGVRALAAS
jgi:branched-chain amino acid aminotransferase